MNAHNEQHDPASAVVKQNLTTQPAAAQEAVAWQWRSLRANTGWKDCTRAVYDVFRQNGLHYEVRKLYAAPVTAAPAGVTRDDAEQAIDRIMGEYGFSMPSRAYAELVDEFMCTPAAPADHLHAHLLHMLGAKDHEDACRIIGELHAATMRNPAAPGIDLKQFRVSLTYAADVLRNVGNVNDSRVAARLENLLALIDASPKGDEAQQPEFVEAAALIRALADYPSRNTHQLQARKVCAGVLTLAMSYGTEVQASPKGGSCATCNGHGMIGGLLPAGGGYESEPCPDCSHKGCSEAPTVYEPSWHEAAPYFECGAAQWDAHTKGMTERGKRQLANMLAHHCLLAKRDEFGWIITRFDLIAEGRPWWHVSNDGFLTYDYDPKAKVLSVAARAALAQAGDAEVQP